ncbi:sensor histidine kinase [Oerskovia merdavium]|uniref:histidine kinase n=1 Tax=Oerskovia merdavium TaxID=2762227 RepID=A0ABR8U0T2_9CELL|nr:histidine kinase [Oerskovia merdavium]MBD7981640.1 two-component sensor histidine kinase [Oerskovia merdavium]
MSTPAPSQGTRPPSHDESGDARPAAPPAGGPPPPGDALRRQVLAADTGHSRTGQILNLAGAAVVAFVLANQLVTSPAPGLLTLVTWLGLVAVAAWVVRVFVPLQRVGLVTAAEVVMTVCGALVVVPTGGLTIAPVFAAIVMAIGRPARPLGYGIGLAATAVALQGVFLVVRGDFPVVLVLGMVAVFVLAATLGFSRRQSRLATAGTQLLAAERLVAAHDRVRSAAFEERARIARDIHDVLAHSLGGLVVQLDAIEALLEAGDVDGAASRVAAGRRLAASGLREARSVVSTLAVPDDDLASLLADHRELGGTVSLVESGDPRPLGREQSTALHRAVQEGLSNARKHAPGMPVRATIVWDDARVLLTLTTPRSPGPRSPLAATGAGHGLTGMRARISALPLGGEVRVGDDAEAFTVAVAVALR